MDKQVFWSQDADFDKEFKGGMYVRSDLGKSFAKWKDNVKIVGIAIDDSNEVVTEDPKYLINAKLL